MKLRFNLRILLVMTGLVAASCAWFVQQRHQRQRELAALDVMEESIGGVFTVVDLGQPGGSCGSWSGAVAHVEDTAPRPLRGLGIDAFLRVVEVDIRNETDLKIIAELDKFDSLRSASFFDTQVYLSRASRDRYAQFKGAVELFACQNPHIDTDYEAIAADVELTAIAGADPFAEVDFMSDDEDFEPEPVILIEVDENGVETVIEPQ